MSLPTSPSEPPPTTSSAVGGIGGYITGSKGCVVEVLDGSRAGEAVVQKDCPYGDAYGYSLNDLPLNEQVTIRASAPGYKPAQVRM